MKADIILADVAWDFKTYTDKGRGRSPKYRTESLDAIAALKVGDLAAENCALFFWVTWPFLFDAPDIIKDWGFRYASLAFEWWKLNKLWLKYLPPLTTVLRDYSLLERLFAIGGGYYTRANSEPCLLCIKGSMWPVADRGVRNYIIAPRRESGRKPDEQYQKIERLYPTDQYPNRVELFARHAWPGWVSLGNEIDGQDLHDSIPNLANNANGRCIKAREQLSLLTGG